MNYIEIKRRAAERLERRAALPNNWSGLSNSEIQNILKEYNIGGWRGAAYMRSLRPRGLIPAFGVRMGGNVRELAKAVKGLGNNTMHTSSSRERSVWPIMYTSRNVNKYRGVKTGPARRIQYYGLNPLSNENRSEMKKNWFASLVRRRLSARKPNILERNARNQATGRVYKIVRNHPGGQWRLKNQATANRYHMRIFRNGGNNSEITIVLTNKI